MAHDRTLSPAALAPFSGAQLQGIRLLSLSLMAATALCGVPKIVLAQTAPSVAAGQATITQTPGKTIVNQTSDRAAINWREFGVRAGEEVRINQPGAGSVSLQRVTGSDPSSIAGKLSSNGNVVIANPNGVLFQNGSQVNVNGLVATTGQVDTDRLMKSGSVSISNTTAAKIVVNGEIKAARGGVTLVGRDIETGAGSLIAVSGGSVNIAGAKAATVDFSGDGLIRFQVGELPGGPITKAEAKEAVDGVVNTKGLIVSNAVTAHNGTVVFGAAVPTGIKIAADKVFANGNIQAPGQTVAVTGNNVSVAGVVDVSGQKAGSIYVGGGWQGAPLETGPNSQTTNVSGTLRANGYTDGGTIAVWSEGKTVFSGSASADGAKAGGNIETSGKAQLSVAPTAKVSAAGAKPGNWLLDPDVLEVVLGGSGTTLDTLGFAGAVGAPSSGVSQIDPTNIASATSNVLLVATTQISLTSGITMFGAPLLGKSLTLNAPSIVLNNSIATNNGDLIIRSTNGSSPATSVSSSGAGIISLGTGKLDVQANTIALAGNVIAANVSLSAGSGALSVGNITAAASGSIALSGGSVMLTGSNVTAGSIGAISAITINSTVGPAVLRGNVIGGTLTTTGGVVLAAATTIGMEGGGSISGAVNGAQSLTLNGPGTMTLTGAVGGATPLASITRSGGVVALGGDVTAGVVNLGSAALLGDTTISSSGGVISGSFDGAHALALRGTGANAITYNGVSGGNTPLASISLASTAPLAQPTKLAGTLIASGAVSLDPGARPILLTGNSAVSSTSAAVVIGGTVDGAYGLALRSPVSVTVGSTPGTISGVGGSTPLASFGVTSNGTVSFGGSMTAGSIDIAAPVALNGQTLTATSGVLAVGSSTQLTMISGTTGLVGQSINVRGPLQLGSAADLSVNSYGLAHFGTIATPSGGTVTLSSANSGAVDLGGFSGSGTLSIAGSGRVLNTVGVFSGAVNGLDVNTIALQSGLTTISQAAGASPVSLGPIGGVGNLSYTNSGTGPLTLASVGSSVAGVSIVNGGLINLPVSLNVGGTSSITGSSLQVASGGISLGSGGRLDLNGPLNASSTSDTVSISSGSGMVALNGAVGGATSFASLTSTGGTLGLGGNVTAATIAISSPLLLTGNATLSAAVSTLTPTPTMISGTVDGPYSLSVLGKPVTLSGVVGGSTPLASLNLSGATGAATIGGNVTTTGAQSYNGMMITGSATLQSGAGAITTGAVDSNDGGQGLTISTGTGAVNVGNLGGGTALASLSISSGQAGPLALGSITSSWTVSINSASVSLSGSTISAGGAVTLGSTVGLTGSNSVTANGAVSLGNLQGPGDLNLGGTVSTVGISSASGVGTLGLMASGTLAPTGSISAATITNLSSQKINIGSNSVTLAQTGAAPMTIGTVVSTGGSFAAASGGNLTLSTSIANLASADFRATGTLNIASGVTIAPTGALSIAGVSISNAGSLSAGGAVSIAADNTISGTVGGTGALTIKTMTAGRGISVGSSLPSTLYLADLSLGNGRTSFAIGGASVGTVSFGGPVSRSGNLDVISGSAISVSAPLSVSGGSLSFSAPTIMASASIAASGGLAKMTGSSVSLAGGNFTNGLNASAGSINLGAGAYSGSISATGATTLAGTFGAPVSIVGSGVLSSGTVSTLSVSGGNLTVNGGTMTGPVNVSGGLVLNGGTISTSSLTASSGITAKGLVTLNSALTGSLTQTGALTLAGFGTPNLVLTQAGFALSAPNLTIAAGSKLSGSMSISGGLTIAGAQVVAHETITAGSVTISGAVTGPGALTITTSPSGRVSGAGSVSGLAALHVSTGTLGLTNAAFTVGTLSASSAITGSYTAGSGGLSVSTPNLSGTITSAGPVTMAVTQVNEMITAPSLSIGPYQGQGPRGAITGAIGGSTTDQSKITLTTGVGSALTFNGSVVGSKPTVATKASVASIASMPTVAVVSPVPVVPNVTPTTAPVVLSNTAVSSISAQILAILPQITTLIGRLADVRPAEIKTDNPGFLQILANSIVTPRSDDRAEQPFTAQSYRDVVARTKPGALIPVGPSIVAGTNAPLTVTPTVKVGAEDGGGQMIARPRETLTVVLDGLLFEGRERKREAADYIEPPLSQQPSTMNEESLFD